MTHTQPSLKGSGSSVIDFSRLQKTKAEKSQTMFFFFFIIIKIPPTDPLVPDTRHCDRYSQAGESNLPELRVLPGQSRLQARLPPVTH